MGKQMQLSNYNGLSAVLINFRFLCKVRYRINDTNDYAYKSQEYRALWLPHADVTSVYQLWR